MNLWKALSYVNSFLVMLSFLQDSKRSLQTIGHNTTNIIQKFIKFVGMLPTATGLFIILIVSLQKISCEYTF